MSHLPGEKFREGREPLDIPDEHRSRPLVLMGADS